MTRKEREKKRFQVGTKDMSADERAALRSAMLASQRLKRARDRRRMGQALIAIGCARGRTVQRRNSDRATDAQRRQLVGARVPREKAEQYRECAQLEGMSLYRFAADALEEYWKKLEEVRTRTDVRLGEDEEKDEKETET